MRNIFIHKVVFLIFSIIFTTVAIAADPILPLPKPIPDQETKSKTAKKKEILPKKNQMIKKKKLILKLVRNLQKLQKRQKQKFLFIQKKNQYFSRKKLRRN